MKDIGCNQIGELTGGMYDKIHEQCKRVYGADGCCPAVHTMGGGGQEIKIAEPRIVGGVGEMKSNNGTQFYQQDRVYDTECVSPALQAQLPDGAYKIIDEQNGIIRDDIVGALSTDGSSPKHNNRVAQGFRIRKLTPRECGRLMDFTECDIDKMLEVNSVSQCYKQCGNGIVVSVLYYIFKEMM